MYLIVGLGNPGGTYANTYHNFGFMVVDKLAQKLDLEFRKKRNNAYVCETIINNQKVILAKPQTYMNLSGQSVVAFCRKLKLKPQEVIVVCDDIDIQKYTIRYKESGSGGTHNGLKNIVQYIGQDFKRIRIGAKPEKQVELKDYVLSHLNKEELAKFEPSFEEAIEKILSII